MGVEMSNQEIIECSYLSLGEMRFFDESMDAAIVGCADGKPVYDFMKMVEILQNAGIDRMDAEDYISDNYYGLYGVDTPVIMRSIKDM